MMQMNVEHVIALLALSSGGIVLMVTNHTEAGIALLGMVGGYAFKNGVMKQNGG